MYKVSLYCILKDTILFAIAQCKLKFYVPPLINNQVQTLPFIPIFLQVQNLPLPLPRPPLPPPRPPPPLPIFVVRPPPPLPPRPPDLLIGRQISCEHIKNENTESTDAPSYILTFHHFFPWLHPHVLQRVFQAE